MQVSSSSLVGVATISSAARGSPSTTATTSVSTPLQGGSGSSRITAGASGTTATLMTGKGLDPTSSFTSLGGMHQHLSGARQSAAHAATSDKMNAPAATIMSASSSKADPGAVSVKVTPPEPTVTSTHAAVNSRDDDDDDQLDFDAVDATTGSAASFEDCVTNRSFNEHEKDVSSKHVRFGGTASNENADPLLHHGNSAATTPRVTSSTSSQNGELDSPTQQQQQRGLVSRRGRYISPGRRAKTTGVPHRVSGLGSGTTTTEDPSTTAEAFLEYKTFRSPPRKKEDEVPSLCSSSSEQPTSSTCSSSDRHQSNPSRKPSPLTEPQHHSLHPPRHRDEEEDKNDNKTSIPTCSISCDRSMIDTAASPLATLSHDVTCSSTSRNTTRSELTIAASSSSAAAEVVTFSSIGEGDAGVDGEHRQQRQQLKSDTSDELVLQQPRNDNPPEGDAAVGADHGSLLHRSRRTMTPPPNIAVGENDDSKPKDLGKTSPSRGDFQTLPSLANGSKLMSPGGLFLSPNPPTPFQRSCIDAALSFDSRKRDIDGSDDEDVPSPRSRDRDRFLSTPTDFALDYKGNASGWSSDTSNVLNWLNSPSGACLFSPGGFGSLVNTPGGGASGLAPRTPTRTPTVSTSFFFTDVAGLPRGESLTPKETVGSGSDGAGGGAAGQVAGGGGTQNSGGSSQKRVSSQQKGISNIICISPLASSKARIGSTSNTPVDLKDVFSSPREKGKMHSMPLLDDTPGGNKKNPPRVPQRNTSSSKDPSLDAIHMAERDLMEDEDLSVLLQLTSNTPKSASGAAPPPPPPGVGGHVFRAQHKTRKEGGKEDLQIPLIGGSEKRRSKSQQSSSSKEPHDSQDFAPPQLGMRSTSSNGSKEMYVGGKMQRHGSKENGSTENKESDKRNSKTNDKSKPSHYAVHHPDHLSHMHPPHQEAPQYYPIPQQSLSSAPAGSMRVVVGCPPPPPSRNSGGKASGKTTSHPPPPYHEYPVVAAAAAGMPYPHPPPHGMYPHPQYPPPPSMGYPHHSGHPHAQAYQGHYAPPPHPPAPRHLSVYAGAQQGGGGSKASTANKKGKQQLHQQTQPAAKPLKGGTKRSSPVLENKTIAGLGKKIKKSPSTVAGGCAAGGSNAALKKKAKSPVPDRTRSSSQRGNSNTGSKNDRAAALAAAILRGVTMRPSGKWQAQLYFAGKSRYIGVFDTREKAALAYEIAREKLKSGPQDPNGKSTENLVNAARKAAFEGVNERGSGSSVGDSGTPVLPVGSSSSSSTTATSSTSTTVTSTTTAASSAS